MQGSLLWTILLDPRLTAMNGFTSVERSRVKQWLIEKMNEVRTATNMFVASVPVYVKPYFNFLLFLRFSSYRMISDHRVSRSPSYSLGFLFLISFDKLILKVHHFLFTHAHERFFLFRVLPIKWIHTLCQHFNTNTSVAWTLLSARAIFAFLFVWIFALMNVLDLFSYFRSEVLSTKISSYQRIMWCVIQEKSIIMITIYSNILSCNIVLKFNLAYPWMTNLHSI